jgi:hypothetical protein
MRQFGINRKKSNIRQISPKVSFDMTGNQSETGKRLQKNGKNEHSNRKRWSIPEEWSNIENHKIISWSEKIVFKNEIKLNQLF